MLDNILILHHPTYKGSSVISSGCDSALAMDKHYFYCDI